MKIVVAYDGTDFAGWQIQPRQTTIQGELERVLSELNRAPVKVQGSGRTDAGVHALAQVAAFDFQQPIPSENLRPAMNRLLPGSIRVTCVEEVHQMFHARHDAMSKSYEYRIWREEICPPFERRYVHHHPYPLNEGAMAAAARVYIGRHDFSAFAAADERRDEMGFSKVRRIWRSEISRNGERLFFQVTGDGFLKHMVRNLMGGLIEVGRENWGPRDLQRLLDEPEGPKVGQSVPGCGLFLVAVKYS